MDTKNQLNNTPFKGAIFDVDGTLMDSMGVWYIITEKLFAMYNIPLSDELNNRFQEMTIDESTHVMCHELGFPASKETLINQLLELAAEEYLYNIPLKPRAYEYLKGLHASGIRLAAATSGNKNLCEGAFKRLGIFDMFSSFAYSDEVGVNKSNPDIYLLAAKRIGVDPLECIVFEDIVPGLCGAKKAGMLTVGVYDDHTVNFEAVKNASDFWIMDYGELL